MVKGDSRARRLSGGDLLPSAVAPLTISQTPGEPLAGLPWWGPRVGASLSVFVVSEPEGDDRAPLALVAAPLVARGVDAGAAAHRTFRPDCTIQRGALDRLKCLRADAAEASGRTETQAVDTRQRRRHREQFHRRVTQSARVTLRADRAPCLRNHLARSVENHDDCRDSLLLLDNLTARVEERDERVRPVGIVGARHAPTGTAWNFSPSNDNSAGLPFSGWIAPGPSNTNAIPTHMSRRNVASASSGVSPV